MRVGEGEWGRRFTFVLGRELGDLAFLLLGGLLLLLLRFRFRFRFRIPPKSLNRAPFSCGTFLPEGLIGPSRRTSHKGSEHELPHNGTFSMRAS